MDPNFTSSAPGFAGGFDGGFNPISGFGEPNRHRPVVLDRVWST